MESSTAEGLSCPNCGRKTNILVYPMGHAGYAGDAVCHACWPSEPTEEVGYSFDPKLVELQEIKSLLKEILEKIK